MRPTNLQRPHPLLKATFPILVFFLACVFTGLPDVLSFVRFVRPVLVVGGLGLIVLFVTGRFQQVVGTPAGKVLTLFTVWFMVCIPFAFWRGGSLQVLVNEWSKSYLAFVLVAGLLVSATQMRKAFHTIAYSVGILACVALRFHSMQDGRLGLFSGRYSNANELGFAMLVGLPFLGYMFLHGGRGRKAAAIILAGPVLIVLSKTGSRAGMLGAAMLLVIAFVQASKAARTKLLFGAPIILVLLIIMMPSQIRTRLTTVFSTNNDQPITVTEESALGSTQARLMLLKDSLLLTLEHPVFGVGPGNFQTVQNELAQQRGLRKGLWHETHNSYTQLSSETGLPGLIIYLAFLYQCWKVLKSIMRKRAEGLSTEVRIMGETLRAAFLVLLTVAAFDSFAYNVNIPVLAGMITAMSFIAQRQRAAAKIPSSGVPELSELPEPDLEPAWSGARLAYVRNCRHRHGGRQPRRSASSIRRMTDIIAHRGPDGDGFYSQMRSRALGHRRLSIIDLATGGQPMSNEDDSLWITYNGEIFNHADIRPELEAAGHRYKSHCDTETVIHAYEQ